MTQTQQVSDLTDRFPQIADCTVKLYRATKDHSIELYDVYRGQIHVGSLEDEGQGYKFYEGCYAKDSMLADDWDEVV